MAGLWWKNVHSRQLDGCLNVWLYVSICEALAAITFCQSWKLFVAQMMHAKLSGIKNTRRTVLAFHIMITVKDVCLDVKLLYTCEKLHVLCIICFVWKKLSYCVNVSVRVLLNMILGTVAIVEQNNTTPYFKFALWFSDAGRSQIQTATKSVNCICIDKLFEHRIASCHEVKE